MPKTKFGKLPVSLQAKLLSEKGINASVFKKWQPGMVVDGQDGAGENEILMDGLIVEHSEIGFYREYMGDESAISARLFRERLNDISGPPRIRMNSPGGDVHEAFAIVQAIEEYDGDIECMVDSLAASAASVVMAKCGKVVASENAEIMIHTARFMAYGTATDFREYADYLDRQNARAVNVYGTRMGKDDKEIMAMMDDETFFTAEEALEIGLVDEIYKKEKSQNRNDDSGMNATTREHLVLQIAALQAA